MRYEEERDYLQRNPAVFALCGAYRNAVRQGSYDVAKDIRKTILDLSKVGHYHFANLIECSRSMRNSRRGKQYRLSNRIARMVDLGRCTFVTLTWTDDALASNKASTRKILVRKALNATACDFVANIDFGKTTHREHYHAVCLNLDYDLLKRIWKKCGYIKLLPVIPSTERSLAMYVDKLCNHALKESAGWNRLMYCRKRNNLVPCVCISQ